MENYLYTSIRSNLRTVAGKDKRGNAHVFRNVNVIQNRVNGVERSITVLDRPNGKAVARLVSDIAF